MRSSPAAGVSKRLPFHPDATFRAPLDVAFTRFPLKVRAGVWRPRSRGKTGEETGGVGLLCWVKNRDELFSLSVLPRVHAAVLASEDSPLPTKLKGNKEKEKRKQAHREGRKFISLTTGHRTWPEGRAAWADARKRLKALLLALGVE